MEKSDALRRNEERDQGIIKNLSLAEIVFAQLDKFSLIS